jgi:hypothetical protein
LTWASASSAVGAEAVEALALALAFESSLSFIVLLAFPSPASHEREGSRVVDSRGSVR